MAINCLRTLIVIPFLSTIGCASASIDDMEGPVTEAAQELVTSNRLTMNRLTMNRLTMNSLSTVRLSPDGKKLSPTALLNTVEGRELLQYLVRCSLPEGKSLSATVSGTNYTFQGLMGLAPDWEKKPLSMPGRRWVTACLLAHVNGYGIQVPISVRGTHPELTVTQSERDSYGLQEISFFGDIFAANDDDEASLPIYACGGSSVQTACGGDAASFRPARSCASADDCEIQFLGACHDLSSASADVCGNVLVDGYSSCHTAPKGPFGLWPYGVIYNEVITVYLAPTDFSSFYTSCVPLAAP